MCFKFWYEQKGNTSYIQSCEFIFIITEESNQRILTTPDLIVSEKENKEYDFRRSLKNNNTMKIAVHTIPGIYDFFCAHHFAASACQGQQC